MSPSVKLNVQKKATQILFRKKEKAIEIFITKIALIRFKLGVSRLERKIRQIITELLIRMLPVCVSSGNHLKVKAFL